jgi:hypothetical protein
MPSNVLKIQFKVEVNPSIVIEPNTKIGADDNVLGGFTAYQKELFTASLQLQISANKNYEAANGARQSLKDLLEAKADELLEKSDAIMKLFCIDVMDVYNLWRRSEEIDIGVREGWILVWTEAVEEETAPYEISVSNN